MLPGNIQAITEAPVLARASGYIKAPLRRYRRQGQGGPATRRDRRSRTRQQVRQAKAGLEQANAALEQANANLNQGKTNEQLYKTTAERWETW